MNLKSKIRLLPKGILSVIEEAGNLADEMDIRAYLVGGFVRDILLDRPNFDVDIVVEENGILFAERLAQVFGGRLITHKRFGTAVLAVASHLKIDIATARKETYAYSGALPEVSFGVLRDDLFRRDFSINAMAVSINKHSFGKSFDYFNGVNDLKAKKIRILHDLSFIDDPTRLLRAIRFSERYSFALEGKTRHLFNEAKKQDMLSRVTKHRIRDELILMLKEPAPLAAIKRIGKLYGFSFIHHKIKLDSAKFKFLTRIDMMVKHFKRQYPKKRALDSWLIFLSGLLGGLELAQVKAICADFAFVRGDTKRIISYCEFRREIIKRLSEKNIRPSTVYHLLEPLSFEVIVLIMAGQNKPAIMKKINEYLLVHNGIKLSVSGKDLKELGFLPGPHFKEMLIKTLHAKIDRIVKDKKDEIKFIKEHGKRHMKGVI